MKWRKTLVTLYVLLTVTLGAYLQFWLKKTSLSYFLMLAAVIIELSRSLIYQKIDPGKAQIITIATIVVAIISIFLWLRSTVPAATE